jgi:hypothetical protein
MFTVEIKINGNLITHIYGYNAQDLPKPGTCSYEVDVYKVASRKLEKFHIIHARENDIEVLIEKILKKANGIKHDKG